MFNKNKIKFLITPITIVIILCSLISLSFSTKSISFNKNNIDYMNYIMIIPCYDDIIKNNNQNKKKKNKKSKEKIIKPLLPKVYNEWNKGGKDDYYNTYYKKHIKRIALKYNLNPEGFAEIIMLETDNGNSKLCKVYNNQGGIKVKSDNMIFEPFKSVLKKHKFDYIVKSKDDDYVNGKLIHSKFYSFKTRLGGIEALASFIRSRLDNPIGDWKKVNLDQYKNSPVQFMLEFGKSPYSTTKNYGSRLLNSYYKRKERLK